ncbi:MAG: ATP-dependent zinc metalloprotease FtsH [Saprospiraceae bacterium]|uniref:ATP-dependent zinc metalloprotease FtsH n=1 Tax=Candidatus Opimibacter skivensis TaxID=2982028 RepID=A0A9D7T1R4_9BACT|nr:ATP-dependent zinc metalloprotease FtsH [Candidatus Opimibacter skivensis]
MSEENNNQDKKPGNKFTFNSYWIYGSIILGLIIFNLMFLNEISTETINFQKFVEMVEAGDVSKIEVVNKKDARVYIKKESMTKPQYKKLSETTFNKARPSYVFNIGPPESFANDINALNARVSPELRVYPDYVDKENWVGPLMGWLIPIFLFLGLWIFMMRRVSGGSGGPGAQIFNIGKSKATLFEKDSKVTVTFADVAGLEEAKEEVMEVVDFLKHPKKYTALGGKIPKGVLLVGPPGTGKTLLAKAVAGEAAVPFFSISGSDFVEMFVGVGASRVRDLFKQAREKAPCIVFIDEIDAIGRARGRNAFQGGNDERENTLNQLLVEMDGFSTDKGVILMAATNRPDILDNALMRPGRFDRQIGLERPDLVGREAIFKVHLKNIKKGLSVDPKILSEMTPGFAGADIANVCNEAALVAARRNKTEVDLDDFHYALDRVIGGLEKRNKLISPEEKEIIAYHEAGHAICGWYLEHASPLVKVTIVPRGVGTLGFAQYSPKEEYITRTEQMLDRMCMALGGRAAESVIFDKISTGAQSDLDHVTKMAYSMVSVYGLDAEVGNVSFYGLSQDQFSKPYSEDTATLIDNRVRIIIDGQYARAQELLRSHKGDLEVLAKTLLEKEVIHKSDIERLIGARPWVVKGHPGKDEDPVTDAVDQGNNLIPPIPNFIPKPDDDPDMEQI